jgi:hypothetical protein
MPEPVEPPRTSEAPKYPITCRLCGISYGPGGEVGSHRPDSDNCLRRQIDNGLINRGGK